MPQPATYRNRRRTFEEVPPKERPVFVAQQNIVGNVKRSLLDFLDLAIAQQSMEIQKLLMPFASMMRKRIHNDLSHMEYQFNSIFSNYVQGGYIPPFGRELEEADVGATNDAQTDGSGRT